MAMLFSVCLRCATLNNSPTAASTTSECSVDNMYEADLVSENNILEQWSFPKVRHNVNLQRSPVEFLLPCPPETSDSRQFYSGNFIESSENMKYFFKFIHWRKFHTGTEYFWAVEREIEAQSFELGFSRLGSSQFKGINNQNNNLNDWSPFLAYIVCDHPGHMVD